MRDPAGPSIDFRGSWPASDAERRTIARFIEFVAREVPAGARILDAGAGRRPYRRHFAHARYESTDVAECGSGGERHDFLCSLEAIPRPEGVYDAVVSTQVLEHVEDPQRVVDEFCRILRPGGLLFLTVPQGWGIHRAPHHYYNFTCYGLASLFHRAGLEIRFIRPRGGIFCYLGKRLRTLPRYVLKQHLAARDGAGRPRWGPRLVAAALLPLYVPAQLLCRYPIPWLCHFLDPLDRRQAFTLGYACCCRKPPDGASAADAPGWLPPGERIGGDDDAA